MKGDDDSSESSVTNTKGYWEGERHQWNGCSCGQIHQRPLQVFWIQCDGFCQGWYNVSPQCVGFINRDAEMISEWICSNCTKHINPSLRCLLHLPEPLLYHILGFIAPGVEKVRVLSQLSLLSSATKNAVCNNPWKDLWLLILERDFGVCSLRASKRRRRITVSSPKEAVEEMYIRMCGRTDDAHLALLYTANMELLTLKRLRRYLGNDPSKLLINRRSPSGRTFLQVCCAAKYADERAVLRCVKELVNEYRADPNVFANGEQPHADRPALFFAISRVMPSVLNELIQAGACLQIKVNGSFRMVSDPDRSFSGSYTPFEFARKLQAVETASQQRHLPAYWMRKLSNCIAILSEHEGNHSSA